MLRLTREAEYGLLAMAFIAARPDGQLAYRREIAEHHNIPREFLAKVLQKLSKKGVIKSHRGTRGGYRLVRGPAEVSLAEIVQAVDGPMALVECARQGGDCPQFDGCTLREALWELQDNLLKVLESVTLADLAGRLGRRPGDVTGILGRAPARPCPSGGS